MSDIIAREPDRVIRPVCSPMRPTTAREKAKIAAGAAAAVVATAVLFTVAIAFLLAR